MIILKAPKKQKHPIIISVPHAGQEIPKEVKESFITNDPLLLTRDSDLYVDELYKSAVALDIHLLIQPFNRYVIDLNRDPSKTDASFVQGAVKLEKPQFIGLVAHKTTQGEPVLKRPLTQEQLKDRIKKYHEPFHNKLTELINNTKANFDYCIHIDAHSMPSKAAAGHIDQGERSDVVPGNRNGTSCDDRLTETIVGHFNQSGLSCLPNVPYMGGGITQKYGNPKNQVHTIQIELNRKLYMDEETHKKIPEKFERLQEIIRSLMVKVIELTQKW